MLVPELEYSLKQRHMAIHVSFIEICPIAIPPLCGDWAISEELRFWRDF